ncbi:MAG: tyrosine-type recombinase/integrase [Blastocatellia bacterium]
MIGKWFDLYIQEKTYLQNLSHHTIRSYKRAYKTFKSTGGELTKEGLANFVIECRKKGMTPITLNTYSIALNVFFAWLKENDYITESLSIKLLKKEKKVQPKFTEAELKKIINYKPDSFSDSRIHAVLCTMIDCGLRIDECLGLERDRVDFDNLLLTVKGKGNKHRIVPFSMELRKVLFRFLKTHNFQYVFPTRSGTRWYYEDAWYARKVLLRRLKVPQNGFHAFRRTFAVQYVKSGGDVFHLQRMMGHESLTTTRIYIELDTKDLSEMHIKTSLLSRLK